VRSCHESSHLIFQTLIIDFFKAEFKFQTVSTETRAYTVMRQDDDNHERRPRGIALKEWKVSDHMYDRKDPRSPLVH
jgi:hypothetical protein